MLKVATPLALRDATPRIAGPSRKLTLPGGVPDAVTVAVNVTLWPWVEARGPGCWQATDLSLARVSLEGSDKQVMLCPSFFI